MTAIGPDVLVRTRRSLHGVAETVVASSQFRATGQMQLRSLPGGFATVAPHHDIDVLAVVGTDLVLTRLDGRSTRWPLAGTYQALAAAAGLPFGALRGAYPGGCGVDPQDVIDVDPAAAGVLAAAWATGDAALRALSDPDGGPRPVLWPEHFDIAITIGEVNYGVSPGDETIAEPYAYVSPFRRRAGAFWDQPFGAARLLRDLDGDADVLGFLTEGRRLAEQS